MFDSLLKTRNLAPIKDSTDFPSRGQDCRLSRAADATGKIYILRLPLSPEKRTILQREVLLLQHNAGRFSFPVPEAEWVKGGMIYPQLSGFPAITTTVEGEPDWQADVTSPVFLNSWAKILVEIHNREDFHSPPFSSLFPANSETTPHQEFLKTLRLVEQKEILPLPDLQRWHNWAEITCWPRFPVPIHGDMHAGNILVDDTGAVTGIIDWTRSGWGDAAQDFIFHYLGFGETGLDQLLNAYSQAGGHVYEGMKEHIIGLWDAYPLRQAFFHYLENESG